MHAAAVTLNVCSSSQSKCVCEHTHTSVMANSSAWCCCAACKMAEAAAACQARQQRHRHNRGTCYAGSTHIESWYDLVIPYERCSADAQEQHTVEPTWSAREALATSVCSSWLLHAAVLSAVHAVQCLLPNWRASLCTGTAAMQQQLIWPAHQGRTASQQQLSWAAHQGRASPLYATPRW